MSKLLGYWPGKRWKQARAVYDRGGCSPTLTAEMGGHGNNYVYILEAVPHDWPAEQKGQGEQ